ncbi:MAG: hypothetical protein U1D30_15615 [Planctomycetota bacterium]
MYTKTTIVKIANPTRYAGSQFVEVLGMVLEPLLSPRSLAGFDSAPSTLAKMPEPGAASFITNAPALNCATIMNDM